MSADVFAQFSIPIKGLKNGFSEYFFDLDKSFFGAFEDALINDASVKVHFTIEKRPEFFELLFNVSGTVKADCDRCLTEIDLPVSNEERLLLKYSEQEEEEGVEVIYILPETSHFNIAKYIHEFVSLALPMVKIYDCQDEDPKPCDQEMLNRLNQNEHLDSGEDQLNNPAWDALKNIKF